MLIPKCEAEGQNGNLAAYVVILLNKHALSNKLELI